MVRKLLYIAIVCTLGILPVSASEVDYPEISQMAVDQLEQPTITVGESTVLIKNANQQVLEVFDLTGAKVATFKIDSDSKTISLGDMKKGCYILRVGKTVRKIYLK